MYNKKVSIPVIIRTPMGGGRGYGPTHSQCLEKIFLGIPGMNMIAPSHFHDPGILLMNSVLKTEVPILFIEHKLFYSMQLVLEGYEVLEVTLKEERQGYPTSIIRNYKNGSPDVTIISYGGTSRLIEPLLRRMAIEEIRILACIPSIINKIPKETIIRCANESLRVIVVEESTEGFNWGSEVAAIIYENLHKKLLAPIVRLASKNTVIPAARHLEDSVLVSEKEIESAIMEVLLYE